MLWLEDGDHDLRPRKGSGFTAAGHLRTVADTVAAWDRRADRALRIATFNINNVEPAAREPAAALARRRPSPTSSACRS